MNEKAFEDAYNLFLDHGYTKGPEEFKKLINENPQALNDAYNIFKTGGYSKGIDDFRTLMGVEAPKQEEPGMLETIKTKLGFGDEVKKKADSTVSPSGESLSALPSKPKDEFQLAAAKMRGEFIPPTGTLEEQAKAVGGTQSYMGMTAPAGPVKKSEKKTYVENLGTNLMSGLNQLNEMIVSLPETVYDVFSIPQNAIAYATGWDISTNSDKLKKSLGVENPVLEYYKEEGKKLETEIQKFNEENYKSSSIYDNIKDGNYGDAFELLGSGIVNSAPVSVAMMLGGATLSPMELAAAGTVGFYGPNQQQLQEENPNASDIENNIKALTMSAAETVFSAVGEGQIGAVYRDIIKREGVEAGTQVFKAGLIDMYKEAIKKYGIPVGLLGEGIEEAATQITQNMVRNRPAFEGAADAFILGGGSGVAFTAPITLKNAKDRLTNEVAKIDDKKQINTILGDNEAKLHTLFDVSKDDAINESQFKIASLGKSRDLLVKDLQQNVRKGVITQDQVNQSLYVFDKTQQIAGQLRDVNIDEPSKVKVANLLKERDALTEKMQGKDEALSVLEKERIGQINDEIKQTIIDSKAKAQAATPSYSINGKEMTEQEFTKAVSEMSPEDVKKADIKANNATEGVTTLLKEVATRSGVASAPMMETTAPAPAVPAAAVPTETEAPKQISRGDLKISVDGTTQGLGNIITENYSEKEDGPIKDNRFSVSARNPVKVESTVKDNGNTELNVAVSHPDNFGRQGAVQFKIEIPKGVEVSTQEIENLIKEKTKQVKLDPQKDGANYKRGVESYLNDIVDNILKPKENAVQKPTTEESVLRTEQPQVELPTVGEGNAKGETTQEGVTPAKPEEVKAVRNLDETLEQNKGVEISNLKKDINKGLGKDMEINPDEVKELDKLEFTVFPKDDIDKSDTDKPIILIRKRGTPELSVSEALKDAQEGKANLSDYFEIVDGRHRIKKALSNGEKLKAVVVTEAEYENSTKTKLYSEETKNILGDLGVKTIEQGIAELENVKSKTDYKKQFGRDLAEDISILEEEQQQRDLLDKPEAKAPAKPEVKPIEQELAELEQMFPTEGPTGENKGVAASDTKAMEDIASRATDERVKKTIKTAQRLMKTLRSLMPTANIYLHENEESYNGAMEEINGNKNSDGHFSMGFNKDGNFIARIDINLNTANPVVVAHEVAHVILNKAFGNNQKLFKSFQEKIAKVLSTESNQALLDFANNPAYQEQGVTYEEYMVQLKALLSEQGTKLELSTAKKIAAVINEYVSRITKGAFKPFQEVTDVKQVVDFVNKVTEAMAKGEEIDVEGAARIGEGSRSSLRQEGNIVDKLKEYYNQQDFQSKESNYYLREDGLHYKSDAQFKIMNDIFDKLGARKYASLVRKYIDPKFTKEYLSYGGRTFDQFLKYELHTLSRDYTVDQIQKLAKAAGVKIDLPAPTRDNIFFSESYIKDIAKAYQEGSNLELVKAVEGLVGKPTEITSRSSLRTEEREITMPDGTKETVKPVSPKIVDGFYSPLEKSILSLKASKWGSGQQVLNELKKAGAKPDELKWTGMEEWLSQQGKVSKDDILNFLDENRVEILEVVKSDKSVEERRNELIDFQNQLEEQGDYAGVEAIERQIEDLSDDSMGKEATKYSQYQLEGEYNNYKEVLVTLPSKEPASKVELEKKLNNLDEKQQIEIEKIRNNLGLSKTENKEYFFVIDEDGQVVFLGKNKEDRDEWYNKNNNGDYEKVAQQAPKGINTKEEYNNWFNPNSDLLNKITDEIQQIEDALSKPKTKEKDKFKSTHWDEPNIAVHLRMNTRTDSEGEKVLFLEELQSDWGQQGKKQGFAKPENTQEIKKLENEKQKVLDSSKSYQLLNNKTKGNLSVDVFNAIQQTATNMIDNPYSTDESRKKRFLDDIEKTISYWGRSDRYAVPKMNKKELSNFYDIYIQELENNSAKISGYSPYYRLSSLENKIREIDEKIFDFSAKEGIPQAPFVPDTKAWTKLGLKTAIKEAIKQGVDRIAWTTGEQQAKRYDLSKQVNRVDWTNQTSTGNAIVTISPNGQSDIKLNVNRETGKVIDEIATPPNFKGQFQGKNLDEVVGKELAKIVIDEKFGRREGEGLKVGGEGMKAFYNNIVPSATKSLVKEITGKEGVIVETKLDNGSVQQSIEITPDLKIKVEVEGMPLFSRSSLRTQTQVDDVVKQARASGYSEKAIEEFLKKRGVDPTIIEKSLGKKEAATKITTNEEMMPGYDKMMEDVNSEILRGLDRKTKETTIEKNVMKIVESSEAYKNATDQQREQIVRDVKEAFGEKMKQGPSAETITGKKEKKVTVNVAQALKDQIKLEMKAALQGAKSVTEKIKAVKDYFDSVKDSGNLTRKDLTRVMAVIAKVKDEKTLEKAVNKINDIIDNAKSDKIEISEKKMIANTIKEVKLAKGNIKEKRKLITDVIDNIKKEGKLSTAQVNALLKRANNLNVESFEHLNKFIDYAEKIFADAEYQNKLSKANALKGSIKKSSKNKSNKYDANLVRLAERFLSIDPSLVENIDEYNKMASDFAEAIKGSSTKGFKPTVEIKSVDAYIEETMKAQKEKLTDMMREQVEELLGVDGSTLTYDEMIKMMESEKKDMSEQKEKIIRSAAIKLFESLSSNIEYILEKGKDPFTGEPVDIKESKKDVVKRFMDMDLAKMDIKDAIAAVDALNNFIVNQSTAKMDDVVSKYEGRQNNAEVNSKGIVSKPLRLYFNKLIGRVMIEEFANLPIVFERLFKSPTMGAYVQKMMGVTELINNKSKAESIVKSAVNKFSDKFYKDKANGENFNSSFNNLERGVFADLYRTIIGTPEQVKQEFERNKGLLEQTIKKLSRGTEAQKKESEILQKVYDKIVKDSDSIEDVKSKMDAKNVEAVDYWVEKWAEHYEDLADVSENVYNRILDKELNYTPKRMSKIKEDTSLETEESAFHKNNGTIFKKSTGSLMEATRPDELPENRYVDYSFDSKMANSFQDALVDVYTAANIRKVEAFIKDKGFEEIFPNAEDRQLLERRIKLMVDNFRNKNHYDYNELNKGMKYVNKLGNIGVAAALGGVFQPIKQTVPVAINTLVNAGGINMDRIFSKSYKKVTDEFLDKSGYAIANRGKESTSDIKAIDTMIEDVAKNAASKGVDWTTKKLGKIQDFYLKKLLVNPDVGIARMSWLTYYEKSLKEQGKDVENIDYSTHELNKEAADYAQKMVDRQQNISDADLKGEFFSDKSAAKQIISKVIFPFASFRMNQSARLASDFITLTSKTATEGDRVIAARSLAGATAEIAAFNAIGAGLTTLLYSVVKSMMADDDEDEEDKKKREEIEEKYIQNLIKGRATSAVQDLISPLPFTDYLVQKGVYNTIDVFNGEEKKGKENEQFNILKPRGREGLQSLGTLGIFPLRMYDLYSITSMASSGTFEDDYGNTKNIREKDKSVLKNVLIPLAAINSTGALPAESYTIQNVILKDIKKRASTQTEAEIIQDKAKKREQRADNIEKIQVINRAIDEATDQDVVNELLKMKRETRNKIFKPEMSDEAKEVLKRKADREKAKYKHLLGGYDSKEDLKRYDPDLYEENFGEGSDYYQTHKAEVKAEKLFDKMMKKTKDEKYGYTPKPKKKGKTRKKNSDGSYSRSSYRYYSK